MGRYLQQALPPNAVVLSFPQSGALAHYTRRPTVRYDLIDGTALDGIVADLMARGYRPAVVLDELFEAAAFRAKFAGSRFGPLDWAPRARARDAVSSLAYFDLADRAAADRQEQWPIDVLTP